VKARGQARRARSDWMKIEQQRGISVTSSVMTFERTDPDGSVLTFNLLDTPGHEDFSEDTYRTLTAVDSAVMVIDAARGIEAQTRKLFEVCRLRSVPIITFINKVDREGRHPFDLLDEVASQLALDVSPMNWPVGMGGTYQGLYDLQAKSVLRPDGSTDTAPVLPDDVQEEIGLIEAGYAPFDEVAYRNGDLTPVFFGSALREFGVADLIDALARFAPSPRSQPAHPEPVSPDDPAVTGFIFKVQANMNPMHRDRVAFMRLCSGKFRRGMKLNQVGTGKTIAVHSPILFFAQNRETAEEAWPGDIIGIPNHGTLRVGDTLTDGPPNTTITGLPNFAPELLRRVALKDPTKTKQLRKALDDLAEEGIIQVFYPQLGSAWIVGVVGQLQLEVLISRLEAEYKVDAKLEASPWDTARWITGDAKELDAFSGLHRGALAADRDGALVFMAKDGWELNYVTERNPSLRFSATKERS
jgi:peptide chain release factor 3